MGGGHLASQKHEHSPKPDRDPKRFGPAKPAPEPSDLRERRKIINDISEAMEPSNGAVGVYGNMYRNGLRLNDSWRTVCGAKAGEVEAKLREIGAKYGVDLLDAQKRNQFIDCVYIPWISGKLGEHSKEELTKLREIAATLKELARFVRARRVTPMDAGDYTSQSYRTAYLSANMNRGPDYVSPIGRRISESALDNDFISGAAKHYCLRGVRLTLEAAHVSNKRRVPWAIHAVNTFRENGDFVEVSGFTAADVDDLPVGSVVIYNHPRDAQRGRGISDATRPGHIQVKIRKPDGTNQWVSDFWQNDGTVYTSMSPQQHVWVFVPKDYVSAGIITTAKR